MELRHTPRESLTSRRRQCALGLSGSVARRRTYGVELRLLLVAERGVDAGPARCRVSLAVSETYVPSRKPEGCQLLRAKKRSSTVDRARSAIINTSSAGQGLRRMIAISGRQNHRQMWPLFLHFARKINTIHETARR
jgi:hypothetical protein